ncbi:MAG: RpiB/LacA/LacB family sugar-phosphate isomerase [Eubacteriales bacterium]|jgi:ribose 5-phosphate isomerase RpiB|nr:RpiB/LacA/LacB family sugar-phosphate isomerase [Eubacteriales bacterium]
MRIAVLNEVSTRAKNADILVALEEHAEHEVYNAGIRAEGDGPELTYIHTGLMAAVLLNSGACDFIVGGCGTGQGFLNSVMQYPSVCCGLIIDPLDAWLFSQINAGNCISLALNKGYGWAGERNLKLLFRELFRDTPGAGYPPQRSESQAQSRERLRAISRAAHRPFIEIFRSLDLEIVRPLKECVEFLDLLRGQSGDAETAQQIIRMIESL